ncbi:NAD-dependent epimerase/dehydratase [Dothidotthia symphoricarpi CBS 119687]|uniref:NAD-dependent epimerase/dehydratase n=1 Tax=Dothidotthia symphoricarpi CBS 119687 TaxID=1392245 RepID=A0A6A6A735_9PLEO|nr:NAD-dependent epimerase/dehydratase [Dothidotthia symphoricarpi CBS 119687]KAF2127630.1 NAD-dependent epimerase/dehydratase [Dothidotthia symphoricarpi CBS 119687]
MVQLKSKVALVTGANGLSGNAIIEHLIRTPKEEFSKIITTSRSPLGFSWQDWRVEFVAIDFLDPVEKIKAIMKEHGCEDVTHAYFTSYVHKDDFSDLKDTNIPLFKNFVDSINEVAGKNLQRMSLQTGGKYYGIHKINPPICPCPEDLPRVQDEHQFYYEQEDYIQTQAAQNGWSWTIIRPDGIIGYAPGKSGMSIALSVALYLITCKQTGEKAKFGGNKFFWNCPENQSYAPSIADLTVWAMTQEHTKNEAFNHGNGDVVLWKTLLHRLGVLYGVEIDSEVSASGSEVKEASYSASNSFSFAGWAADKRPVWETLTEKYGGKKEAFDWATWWFLDWAVGKAWPTMVSTNKARAYGWTRFDDSIKAFMETIRAYENGGVLPSVRDLRKGEKGNVRGGLPEVYEQGWDGTYTGPKGQ